MRWSGSRRPPAETGEPQDVRALARRLVELLESSRPLPILRDQVRVESPTVYDIVTRMRARIAGDAGEEDPSAHVLGPLLEAAEEVEDAVYHAMPVPLMDEVRLPQERVAELLGRLRAAGA